MENNKRKKQTNSLLYSVKPDEPGESSIPSITSLLNRKKYVKSGTSAENSLLPLPKESTETGAFSPPEIPDSQKPDQLHSRKSSKASSRPPKLPPKFPGERRLAKLSKDIEEDVSTITEITDPPTAAPLANTGQGTQSGRIKVNEPSHSLELQIVADPEQDAGAPKTQPRTQTVKYSPNESQLAILPARRKKENQTSLTVWDANTLYRSNNPVGKALSTLLQKNLDSALYLSIAKPPEGCRLPHFHAKAAYGRAEKIQLWNGFHWDPATDPFNWRTFLKEGVLEIEGGSLTHAAFGLWGNERLTLIRVGAPSACRGMLALVSEHSLLPEVAKIASGLLGADRAA